MLNLIKKVTIFVMCQMILTTFVFAQHTRVDVTAQIQGVVNYTYKLQAQKNLNQCSDKVKSFVLPRLENQIEKAKNSSESLEEAIVSYQNKFSYLHYKQAKKTKRLLKRNRKLNRIYRNVKKSNPELTFNQMVANLKYSRSVERRDRGLAMIETELLSAGSLVNYLESLKENINNCVMGETLLDTDGGNMGLILLILFIGLPVLSILAALITLVIGAFGWALGFFLFAVVMLAALFVMAQFPMAIENSLNQRPDEV